jgi:hypothetical protein
MCTKAKALRELIAHIESAAEVLEGRNSLFHSRFGGELRPQIAEAYAEVAYDCNFLVRAVSQLRPLIEKEEDSPHQV